MVLNLPQATFAPTEADRWWSITDKTKEQARAALEDWRAYIFIPDRRYIVDGEFILYSSDGGEKQIDRASNWWDILNSIARELTVRIKRWESDIFAFSPWIQNIQDLLLALASQEQIRRNLTGLNHRFREFILDIENGAINNDTEIVAERFCQDFRKVTGLWDNGISVITKYSWASDEKFKNYKHSCDAWMIIICVMGMIKFEKSK